MFSESIFSSTARRKSPALKKRRLKSWVARAAHRRSVFTVSVLWPTMNESYGTPRMVRAGIQSTRSRPSGSCRDSVRPPRRTTCASSRRGSSQGLPLLSQLSCSSTCLPSSMRCSKIPKS
jgi:hypothetical protein